MPGMLDLRDIFQLINDRFDDGSLAQQDLIDQQHQAVLHVLAQLGDQLQVEIPPELLHQLLRDVAAIAKQFAMQTLGQGWHWFAVIAIPR